MQIKFGEDERRLPVRPAHRRYLADLLAAGKLVTAGPWADDTGALLVYEVADEAELRGLLARDPYLMADVCEIVQLREWRPILP